MYDDDDEFEDADFWASDADEQDAFDASHEDDDDEGDSASFFSSLVKALAR